ncbi:MAG: hypothetical protein LQ341_001196 [Variospora aurantia]|nr:MAG: hypothetical protein LQ341_001196 [Variospora aurantia]
MLRALANKQTKFQLGDNDNLFDFTYVGNAAHAHILAAIALLATDPSDNTPDRDRPDGQAFFITNAQPVYFWDFARAVWAAAGDPVSLSAPASITAINKPLGLMIASLLEFVYWVATAGRKSPSMTRGIVKFSCMTRYFDTARARRVLGYEPRWGLPEAVERSVAWFQKQEKGKEGVEKEKEG